MSGAGTPQCGQDGPRVVVESFFATLKTELVADARWTTRAAATAAIAEFIEGWYNRRRRHSTLDYLSPAEFEARLTAA